VRVLAVTNLWPENGSHRGVFVAEQVAALRRLGHEVDVEVVAQSRGTKDYVLAVPRVRRRARSGRYDVVHVHYGMTAFAARFAGPTPRVLSLYGSDVNSPKERRITRLGSGGLAARLYVSRRLAATAGDPAGQVVPNGVDFTVFTPGDRAAARQRLGLPAEGPVVLFGGSPENAVKGYDVFTDVLARLPGARGLILSAPGQPVEDVVTKYRAADVLLFTSRRGSEGSPTVVKEATAVGLPVVSVDVGDTAEILGSVTPSEVVAFPEPWGTPGARETLVSALADATAEVLGAGVRSDGRERNAWLDSPRIAERIAAIYREVAGAGAAAGTGGAAGATGVAGR
jgi:glycosyltransferase involved in cell wall biosynthesis